jgi:hypothetical protein
VSLPKIVTPEYYVQLKSAKQPVKYRPYLVKEEKVFLTAKESGDPKEVERAIRQILRACTFDALDIEKLPSFDIEYLFLQLRARSVNNIIEVQYQCQNKVEDGDERCGGVSSVRIPIDEITIDTPEDHKTLVPITDELTLEMQYPTVETLQQFIIDGTVSSVLSTELVVSCIKSIVDKDGTVYESRDYDRAELRAFVDSLSLQQIEKLQVFFGTMPTLRYATEFVCRKCGYREPIVFEGIQDFFD